MVLDVLLRDATAPARASNLRNVEAVLGEHACHDGRDEGAVAIVIHGSGRDRSGCRSDSDWFGRSGSGWRRRCLDDRCRCSRRGGGSRRGRQIRREHSDARLHVDRHALGYEDLDHHAGGRRRHLRVDLVGRDLDDRLIGLDGVAHLLEPTRDRSLGNAGPHLGHNHINRARDRHRRTSVRVEAASGCTVAPLRPDRRLRPKVQP